MGKVRAFKRRLRENSKEAPREAIPITPDFTNHCVRIWRTVILHALSECNKFPKETRNWINSEDFLAVCGMADICPIKTKDRFRFIEVNGSGKYKARGGYVSGKTKRKRRCSKPSI